MYIYLKHVESKFINNGLILIHLFKTFFNLFHPKGFTIPLHLKFMYIYIYLS